MTRGKCQLTALDNAVHSAMEHYWVKLPQLKRVLILALGSVLSFGVALSSFFRHSKPNEQLELFAYVLLILNILIGEIVVEKWRISRDAAIADAIENDALSQQQDQPHGNHYADGPRE